MGPEGRQVTSIGHNWIRGRLTEFISLKQIRQEKLLRKILLILESLSLPQKQEFHEKRPISATQSATTSLFAR
jgi:hypothetical protein